MNESRWTKLSAIAEIISSVAIVVTLAYLALQTQQNTSALLSASRQETLNAELTFITQALEYPYLDTATTEEEIANLTREQRARMFLVSVSLFRTRENYWNQYRNGVLDRETWLTYRSTLLEFIKFNPYVKQRWEANVKNQGFDVSFLNEINSALESEDINTDYRIF